MTDDRVLDSGPRPARRLRPRAAARRVPRAPTSASRAATSASPRPARSCSSTNEGNGRLCTSVPRVHIAVMGMERIVADWQQLDLFVNLLARSATGQHLSSYTNIITGPRREARPTGPTSCTSSSSTTDGATILGTELQEILSCIRCGACLNVCPVYRQIGGHAYGWVYSGPVGAVLTPLLAGAHAEAAELSERVDALRCVHGRLPGEHPAAGPAARAAATSVGERGRAPSAPRGRRGPRRGHTRSRSERR